MVQYHRGLVPGTLYITITLPESLPYTQVLENDFTPMNPETFDVKHYESHSTHGSGREEFEWGLYFHHGPGFNKIVGAWYIVVQDPKHPDDASQRVLVRQDMTKSPRLFPQVVGLVSILRLPDHDPTGKFALKLAEYLNWLAHTMFSHGHHSYLWAMMAVMRMRRHVAKKLDLVDNPHSWSSESWGFLAETLEFAYEEVWYGLAGQLPRPILESEWEARFVEKSAEHEEQTRDAAISQNLDMHWPLQELWLSEYSMPPPPAHS
ncbi:Fc.00g070800.m01.CDS01 [Cosmosporella sp. VM-42]